LSVIIAEIVDFVCRCLTVCGPITGCGCEPPLVHQFSPYGIIGDTYIRISFVGDLDNTEENGSIVDTESAVDIESLISKFALDSV